MQRDFRGQIRVGPESHGRGGLSERKKKENINGAMSTYVRLVDQTIRYTTPRIIPSFYRGEIKKKKRYSDRAVRPCSFLLDADGQASSCRNGVGRQRLLPRGQLEGAEVRRRAFWLLIYSSTELHPTAPVLLVGLH
ncbi:hypothetical protein VNO78_35170 [Psophocarpus tetragonolobus]|uniref:Uncharacterized protein n=1 Tax=Psophocarpus tetragonolobus TaxID=3891 RepID=A0AAN9RLQ9_PSOTE